MRLNISAWAIRKPIAPLVLFMVLMALEGAQERVRTHSFDGRG